MGTRCLTIVHDDDEKQTPIVCMYRQFDGYPDGHGKELTEFLKDMVIVNGIGRDSAGKKAANGMGCLAAQLVAHFKEGIGGFYLYPPDTRDVDEEYIYHVKQQGSTAVATCEEVS